MHLTTTLCRYKYIENVTIDGLGHTIDLQQPQLGVYTQNTSSQLREPPTRR